MDKILQKYHVDNFGVSGSQFGILHLLHQIGELPLNKIGAYFSVSNANVTGMVDRLEKQGYVERKRSLKDRRIVHVRLKPKGEELVERAMPRKQKFIEMLMNDFDDEKKAALCQLLVALRESVKNNYEPFR